MIRAPPVCALTAQIASICISNVELQQFFAPESRPNSFVTPNFTAETFVEPDGSAEFFDPTPTLYRFNASANAGTCTAYQMLTSHALSANRPRAQTPPASAVRHAWILLAGEHNEFDSMGWPMRV